MHWPFDFARSPFQQQQGFATAMNTVDDISYCPSTEEKTRNAEQIVVTGRRNWKLMKGKKEAVWPPNLEALLLEALETYKPHSSKPLEQLGRYPMRNRFISDYIYEMTGKRRTPKQVGSRLQQLRDTCKKAELLKLISRRNTDEHSKVSTEPSDFQHPKTQIPTPPNSDSPPNIIDAEIILDDRPGPLPIPAVPLTPVANTLLPLRIRLALLGLQTVRPLASCTDLSGRDPTVEIHSPCPLFNQTIFSVFCEGSDKPIHYEVGSLSCHSSPPETCIWIYSSPLVPAFWSVLRKDKEPTKYTVQQGIIPLRPLPGSRYTDSPGTNDSTTTLVYRFILPPKIRNIEDEAEACPLSATLSFDPPHHSYERLEKSEPSHYEGPWSSHQNPYTVSRNLQTHYNYNSDVAYPAPFPYLSADRENTYHVYAGSGLQQRYGYNRSSWSPQPESFEDKIPLNTSFHHVGFPTSF